MPDEEEEEEVNGLLARKSVFEFIVPNWLEANRYAGTVEVV